MQKEGFDSSQVIVRKEGFDNAKWKGGPRCLTAGTFQILKCSLDVPRGRQRLSWSRLIFIKMKHSNVHTSQRYLDTSCPATCYLQNQGLRKQAGKWIWIWVLPARCTPWPYCHFLVYSGVAPGVGVLGSRDSSQVLMSTVCSPSISWFSRRLHRVPKFSSPKT